MAEEQGNGANQAAGANNGNAPTRQVALQRIYLKDLSFESPSAPRVFKQNWTPSIGVDLRTGNNVLEDGTHDVLLTITVTAKLDEQTAYVVEVQQGGIFRIEGVEGEDLRRVLTILCPTTLFPYARETIDTMMIKGTFPPLMLAQVNFEALYMQALEEAKKRAESGGVAEAPTGEA